MMERYIIEQTKSSPYVDLNPHENKLLFQGQSYPENAYKLYEPIFQWIDSYFMEIGEKSKETIIRVEFCLSYVNTSSTKCLLMLFEKFNQAYLEGKKIEINWQYDEDNGYDFEMGQEFQEFVEIPFNFIAVNH